MRVIRCATALVLLLTAPLSFAAETFDQCLDALRAHAASQGIGADTRERAFASIRQQQRVLELDASQPEFIRTFWQYFEPRVSLQRVEKGRELLAKHRPLLQEIHAEHGVRPEYLVALWGMETNYGSFLGGMPVLDSLATLACDQRRSEFFRSELIEALRILEQDRFALERMVGSWAGAMGHTQFMPSTFTRHALDYDGDGRRDLWGSLPDAFASSANYLRAAGWRDGERWGREVRVPSSYDWGQSGLDLQRSLREWRALGLRAADGSELPDADMQASLLLPQGHRGPAFLVYHNFRVLMRWNNSTNYALAVGHLADRIAGLGQLHAQPPGEHQALSRAQVLEMQQRLNTLGFDAGEPDGIVGRQTRAAIRAFQREAGLPADGYADHDLWKALQASNQ